MPYDFFTVGIAEVLIRAGQKTEGELLLREIMAYSKEYLDYAISIPAAKRFGLDYPQGINMQAMLDIYNMSTNLKLSEITAVIEPDINNYYSLLYSGKK